MTDFDDAIEKDSAELANEQGFTGTFAGFISWLEDSLIYGGVRIIERAPNRWGRIVTTVETFTGGYSSDEALLGRLRLALLPSAAWVRSERGGLTVYEFADWLTDSEDEHEWLAPANGVFKQIYRARTVRVEAADGTSIDYSFDGGVEMVYLEAERDIINPAGVVIVRPAPPLDLPWTREQPAGTEDTAEAAPGPKPAPPKRRLIPAAQRTRAVEGQWKFTRLAREQAVDLGQTTADIAALLDGPHVSVTAPSGTATNRYVDDLQVLVAMDEPVVISVVEVDPEAPHRREPSPSLWAPAVKAPSGGPGRRMPSSSKEFLAMLAEHGFTTEHAGGGHPVAAHPKHPSVRVTIPGTPSDHRSFMNTVALLRRLTGIDITRKAG